MTLHSNAQLLAIGPPEVQVDGRPLALSPKRLAVLAYLALGSSGGVARRDSLLAIFWPEADESHARNALNQALYHLRQKLGSETIGSRGHQELVLDGRLGTDVEAFEAHVAAGDLDSALSLYRGGFLEGLHTSASPEFERWVDVMRARIRRRARTVSLRLAAAHEAAGRTGAAVATLRRALEIDPVAEEAARALIRLLLDAGKRATAQREYRRIAWRLRIRAGIRPSQELRRMIIEAGLDPDGVGSGPDLVSLPSPVRTVAVELTDRARELLDVGPAENAAARELLDQAVRVDPTYAPAHAASARAIGHWVAYFGGGWEALPSGVHASDRALELDPELPEANLARGYVLERAGQLDGAMGSYRTLLQLRPGHPGALGGLGRIKLWGGAFDRALMNIRKLGRTDGPTMLMERAMIRHCLGQHDLGNDLYRRALEVDPDDRFAWSSRVYFSFVTGHRDRAVRQARQMVDRQPDGFIGIGSLADAVLVTEDFDEAIRLYERCYRLSPSSRNWGILRAIRTALGFVHIRAGEADRGRQLLNAAERETRKALQAGSAFGGLHYDLASIYAARGETEPALTWLERSVAAGWHQHEFLCVDPIFERLRGEERFTAARREMEGRVREQRNRLG